MSELSGRSVLVLGASGGLGAPITARLREAGARLTLLGRDERRLRAVAGDDVLVVGDLRDPSTPVTAVRAAVDAYDGLDGLVIASGVVAFGPVADLDEATLSDLFVVNALAPMRAIAAATAPLIAAAQAGRDPFVLVVSAVVAEQPTAGMAAYSASKAALTAFDTAAARELRRAGVRVIDARPPHTETGLAARPIAGAAPALPPGLSPESVAERMVRAIVSGERDLPAAAFTDPS